MTIKVHLGKPYTIPAQEMEFFYGAMINHRDDLQALLDWADKQPDNPAFENAKQNIRDEIAARSRIILKLYEHHFSLQNKSSPVDYVEAAT